MKNLYLIFITLVLGALTARSQTTFTKEYHNYKIDTNIRVVVPYKGCFYCLKSNHEIFIVNYETNKIDSSYQDNSKDIKLEDIYVKNDTLIGFGNYTTFYLNAHNNWLPLQKPYSPQYFYQDSNYYVKSTCSGEWGGSLYFIDKRTKKQYECICTCVINIHNRDGKYWVTASLAHMSGFTNIFQIEDPSKLKFYNLDSIKREAVKRKKLQPMYIGVIGDNESKSIKGTKQLIDSIGITCEMSFEYKSKVYYLINKGPSWKTKDYHFHVYIDTLNGSQLAPLEDITNFNISNYNSTENRKGDIGQTSAFSNDTNTGFVYFGNNKFVVYSFQKKHN